MHRIIVIILLVLGLAGCTGDEQSVQDAERSVKEDAEMLADVLEPLCARESTCPRERFELPLALMRALADGNDVEYYKGRHFEVFLCVANKEHGVWAWYASEYEAETHRGGEPCKSD